MTTHQACIYLEKKHKIITNTALKRPILGIVHIYITRCASARFNLVLLWWLN